MRVWRAPSATIRQREQAARRHQRAKAGTLDALVRQADELAKLDANVEGAVAKVVDVLKNIVPGQEAGHKLVGDSELSRLAGL